MIRCEVLLSKALLSILSCEGFAEQGFAEHFIM